MSKSAFLLSNWIFKELCNSQFTDISVGVQIGTCTFTPVLEIVCCQTQPIKKNKIHFQRTKLYICGAQFTRNMRNSRDLFPEIIRFMRPGDFS